MKPSTLPTLLAILTILLAQPTFGDTLTINNGNSYTNNNSVFINISIPNQSQSYVTEGNETPRLINTSISTQWNLSSTTNGTKFFSLSRNNTTNITANSSIILDKIEPNATLLYPLNGATYHINEIYGKKLNINITDQVDDNNSLLSLNPIYSPSANFTQDFFDYDVSFNSNTSLYNASSKNFSLLATLGTHRIQIFLKDSAGNTNIQNFSYTIIPNNATISLYEKYDTNNNTIIEKAEAINAVVIYFTKNENLSFSQIKSIVIKYLSGSSF